MYGAAKYCPKGPESCKDQTQLTEVMATSRNYDELTDAWTGWHSTARPMRKDYVRFVELANEGARNWALPISVRCGARVTTCRRMSSRRKRRVCGIR